jgi:starch-binding outer membrane protein, SusD/RagB family
MKKISYILLLILFAQSCNVLDLESPDTVLEEEVFSTADGFRNARIGMYSSLAVGDYYGGNFPLLIDGTSDNGATGGYAIVDYDEIGAKNITSTNVIVEKLWASIYKTIAVTNHIINKIDRLQDATFSQEERDNIKGEAYFMRALCHFDALRTWGEHWDKNSSFGIPIITSVQSFDAKVARATVSNCYAAINADLAEAEKLVLDDYKTSNFVTTAAVKALQARVALYEQDKTKAAKAAAEVISSSSYALYQGIDVAKVYTVRLSPESIFELGFSTFNRSNYNQLTYVRPDALRPEVLFFVSEDLGKFFEARTGDYRATFVNYKDNDAGIQPDGRTEKYRGEQIRDNPAYILRLAEMYLIVAETAEKSEALAALNTLRVSRGLKQLSNISDDELAQAVEDERRAELNMEGHRYFDLARLGKVETIISDETKPVLPIPQREIVATGGLIIQNKGY